MATFKEIDNYISVGDVLYDPEHLVSYQGYFPEIKILKVGSIITVRLNDTSIGLRSWTYPSGHLIDHIKDGEIINISKKNRDKIEIWKKLSPKI